MKGGLKVHPGIMTFYALLGREDIGNEVVPVEEPTGPKDVKNIKDGKLAVIRDNWLCMHWNRRDDSGHQGMRRSRRRRGSLFRPFGQERGKGRVLSR